MIILASTSYVRAKILKDFGINFIQKNIDFDEESIKCDDPKTFVYLATKGKYESAKKLFKTSFLVADTVVSVGGVLQRKAKDALKAKDLLKFQSQKEISVLTCMIYKSCSFEFIDISATKYQLKKFNEEDLIDYINSKAWEGKAGCVMVEGFHKKYIQSQIGLESTALGLSIEKLLPFLEGNI